MEAQGYDRLAVYREMLQEAGLLSEDALVENCGAEMKDGYQATLKLLSQPNRTHRPGGHQRPAGNRGHSRGNGFLGLNVPNDLSICEFQVIFPLPVYNAPWLTTVSG